jgi:hypothetical protein
MRLRAVHAMGPNGRLLLRTPLEPRKWLAHARR